MAYVIVEEAPSEVFHYTKRGNLDSILRDRTIRRFSDTECWFCLSLKDTLACMQQTVMDEGKPFYRNDGSIGFYPKFHAGDYVILRLTPDNATGEWVHWMQEMPSWSTPDMLRAAREFSLLKFGYRGDLRFAPAPVVIKVSGLLR